MIPNILLCPLHLAFGQPQEWEKIIRLDYLIQSIWILGETGKPEFTSLPIHRIKKGTAIPINKNLAFILEYEEQDSEVRFILITGLILKNYIYS